MVKSLQLATLGVLFGAVQAIGGPVYYLFNGDSAKGHKVELPGGTVQTFNTFNIGYPVAIIGNAIRLHDRNDGSGVEYDLNGVPTGGTSPGNNTPDISQLLDGTTDGTYNYAVQCCGSTNWVWRASLNWQNFEQLFQITPGGGITYDSADGVLFISDFGGTISRYSMTGTLLNSFSAPVDAALAYDAASDTLFGHDNGTQDIVQFSKTGTVLNTYTVSGLSGNIYGGEIASSSAVPEPGAMGLFALGMGGLVWLRRRRA